MGKNHSRNNENRYCCPSCTAPLSINHKQKTSECFYCRSIFRFTYTRAGIECERIGFWREAGGGNTNERKSSSGPITYPGNERLVFNKDFWLVLILIMTLCLGSIICGSSINNSIDRNGAITASSTALSPSPTWFRLKFPVNKTTPDGWVFTITEITVDNSISNHPVPNKTYIIILLDVLNTKLQNDCLKGDEFFLIDGKNRFPMSQSDLDSAKDRYKRDYPGFFVGLCFDPQEKKRSIMVFNVIETDQEFSLNYSETVIRLGNINALSHPLPTETPTPTNTKSPTSTPTKTPTPLPVGKIDPLRVDGNYVNIRSGPGTDHEVAWVQDVNQDFVFKIVGRNQDNKWLLLQTENGNYGWISAYFINTEGNIDNLSVSTQEAPTLAPTPTPSTTPVPTQPYYLSPPKGIWCSQNSDRGVCAGEIEYRDYLGYSSAGQNSRYIVIAVFVKNIGYSKISVNPFDFTIVMDDNSTFEHAAETYHYKNALQGVNVSPGNLTNGVIVFYVPKDVGPKKLICDGGLWESEIEINFHSPPNK